MSTPSVPAEPRPAASVVIVRQAAPTAPEPIEVWMIRRKQSMKFLGGYYAFPGGRVDVGDGSPEALACCRGLDAASVSGVRTIIHAAEQRIGPTRRPAGGPKRLVPRRPDDHRRGG